MSTIDLISCSSNVSRKNGYFYHSYLQSLIEKSKPHIDINYIGEIKHDALTTDHAIFYFDDPDCFASRSTEQHIHRICTQQEKLQKIALINFELPKILPSVVSRFEEIIECCNLSLEQALDKITHFCRNDYSDDAPCRHVFETFFLLNFVGKSNAWQNVVKKVDKISRCEAPVLIQGETGTGKEVIARSVHYLGPQNQRGFIPINCAAIPDSLFESELFGHEKGAFTDAQQRHEGIIALAEGGTLFLDEVDSLSMKAQSALLRFLQTGEYRSVGSNKIKQANVRIVSATNANLSDCVQQGKFREDLYFRLNVLKIHIPPLRDRLDDIEVISQYLLDKFEKQHKRGRKIIHSDSIAWLKHQSWDGNVRELENFLLREYLLNDGTVIKLAAAAEPAVPNYRTSFLSENMAELFLDNIEKASFNEAKNDMIHRFSCQYISSLLKLTSGNVTEAARIAGKERRAFGKLIKRYNIDKQQFIQECLD